MDFERAKLLVESLFDRIERDEASGKWKLGGAISVHEREALRIVLAYLGSDLPAEGADAKRQAMTSPTPAGSSPIPQIAVDTRANDLQAAEHREVIMCIDFGTAMSKAFAIHAADDQIIDLALGKRAGYSEAIYPVPSSLFISGAGRIYLGHEAISQSQIDPTPGRERFDSPKQELSQGAMHDLASAPVSPSVNPTNVSLSKEELITLYLAYLTDLACCELTERHKLSRYIGRRFARPCWKQDRVDWAETLLKRMLARAQIVADTFSQQWLGGLDIRAVRSVFDQIRDAKSPSFLVDEGVAEPVAAASGVVMRGTGMRRGFLVVDVGAGTTDFGLFVMVDNSRSDGTKVFQVRDSINGVRQAGDTIDSMLRAALLTRHPVDLQSAYGQRISGELNLRVRGFKETLFRSGKLQYSLADDASGELTLEDFLARPEVGRFQTALQESLQRTLDNIDASWIENLFAKQGLLVVLTGGGARLPMVRNLAEGVIESRGFKIARTPASLIPDWIRQDHPEFEPEYPQLAVALGGASPELPALGPEFCAFGGGLRTPTYGAGNLPITGS